MFRKTLFLWLTIVAVSCATWSADAFVIPTTATTTAKRTAGVSSYLPMVAEEENTSSSEDETTEQQQQVVNESSDAADEQEEAEDPVLTALKEEISKAESELKEKRRQLAYTQDQADDYTKTGYARRVAEMENMRRARSMLNSSNKSSSTAGILTKFLPILDKLLELRAMYSEDDFGKQYNALMGDMRGVFTKMGVVEYTLTTGDAVDPSRILVVDSQYSDEFAADTVLQPIANGLELQGNILRMAECVASLGPEAEAVAEEEQEGADSPGEENVSE